MQLDRAKRALLIFLAISIILNVIFSQFLWFNPQNKLYLNRESSTDYPLLSKRIFAENQNDLLINFVPLRTKLQQYHATVKEPLGFYFEYLPSGNSIGVNEKESFVLASLLKVPLAMGIYKSIEEGKMKETDVLEVKEEYLDPLFGDLWKQGAGTKLTVEDLVKLSLIESDNTAQKTLFNEAPPLLLEKVFDSLDIPKELSGNMAVVTPKNYSSILRSLYLSSYLTKEDSTKVLDLLTQTPFNDRIVAGVSPGITVSHKIGVHAIGDETPVYTDCGIVYAPRRPYILCIMTKTEENNAKEYMKDISKMIYDYVSRANK